MAIPGFQSFMLPLLRLASDGKTHQVSEAMDALAEQFSLTHDEVNELLPSGTQPRFRNRVNWAATYLKKGGLLESPRRAHVRITDRGRSVLAKPPSMIDIKFLEKFDEFVDFRRSTRDDSSQIDGNDEKPASNTPEEALLDAYQMLQSSLATDILDAVKKAPPEFFERLVVDLLVQMGYGGSHQEAGQAIGKSGDEGIDGIIKEDRLGLDIIYIQAKRWESVVGRPEVQKFRSSRALYRDSERARVYSSQLQVFPAKRSSTQPTSRPRSFSSEETDSPSS